MEPFLELNFSFTNSLSDLVSKHGLVSEVRECPNEAYISTSFLSIILYYNLLLVMPQDIGYLPQVLLH